MPKFACERVCLKLISMRNLMVFISMHEFQAICKENLFVDVVAVVVAVFFIFLSNEWSSKMCIGILYNEKCFWFLIIECHPNIHTNYGNKLDGKLQCDLRVDV